MAAKHTHTHTHPTFPQESISENTTMLSRLLFCDIHKHVVILINLFFFLKSSFGQKEMPTVDPPGLLWLVLLHQAEWGLGRLGAAWKHPGLSGCFSIGSCPAAAGTQSGALYRSGSKKIIHLFGNFSTKFIWKVWRALILCILKFPC